MAIGTPRMIILGPMTTKNLSNMSPEPHFASQRYPDNLILEPKGTPTSLMYIPQQAMGAGGRGVSLKIRRPPEGGTVACLNFLVGV